MARSRSATWSSVRSSTIGARWVLLFGAVFAVVPRLVVRPAPLARRCLPPPSSSDGDTVRARRPGCPSRARASPRRRADRGGDRVVHRRDAVRSVPTAISSMPSSAASRGDRPRAPAGVVELGHHAERRRRADRPGSAASVVERRPHRRRVGVVGVVEDDRARPRRARSSMRHGDSDAAGERVGGAVERHARARRATASAAAALSAMWAPAHGEPRPGTVPHGVSTRERGPGRARRARPRRPRRRPRRRAERQDRGRACGRRHRRDTRWSSALRIAVPSAGSASTSSALARATPSMPPTRSVCAAATAVTTPIVGRRDVAQPGDLAEPAHAHLEDQHLGVVGCVEDRRPAAPARCCTTARVGRGPPARAERGRGQVLRARLADRAGDADHAAGRAGRGAQRRQVHQRRGGVVDDDRASPLSPARGRP